VARKIEAFDIPGPAGILEALLEEPEDAAPLGACLLCHPHPAHGGTMHNKVVYRMAKGLRRSGRVVLRFNFRGVGRSAGAYSHMVGELEDARAALEWLRARYPSLPYSLAGFSFGSRIIMRLGCSLGSLTDGPRVLIGAGFPTWREDNTYLTTCSVPKLFVQSTVDEFGPRADLEALFATMAQPKELRFIEAGDHFFAGALPQLEDTLATYRPTSG
jgi:alpha/beta superfamily hydrolase